MSATTGIQWTDATWNPVVGCTKVSQGCKHCYAKTLHDLRHSAHLAGKKVAPQYAAPFETVQLMPARLRAPLSWRQPKKIFVNSVSDLFHEDVPDDFLAAVFGIMAAAPRHTFQVLTKRVERMLEWFSSRGGLETREECVMRAADHIGKQRWPGFAWDPRGGDYASYMRASAEQVKNRRRWPGWPLPNVWLGVSVENQAAADERIPRLLNTPAAVHFLSCEPLLGPIDLDPWLEQHAPIDWVIVGGESGKGARPCDVEWIEQILADCDVNGVPAFVKQLGARPVCANDHDGDSWPGSSMPIAESYEPHHQGEIAPLELFHSHGGDANEWPERLRVREFPRRAVSA